MSKPKPGPKRARKATKAKPDPNEFDLRLLVLYLEQATRFSIGVAYVDTYRTRERILGRVQTMTDGFPIDITVLDLGKHPGEELLLHRLQEHLRENPAPEGKHPVVMVVGLEAVLDYRGFSDTSNAPQPILRNANIQRDAYPRLIPATLVFWLLPAAAMLFAREAPDFWDWRTGMFRFSGSAGDQDDLEQIHLSMPIAESYSLPAAGKRDRTALLQGLLVQQGESEDQDSRGALARKAALLNELGLAKHAVSKNSQAIPDFEQAAGIYHRIGDRFSEGRVLANLGTAHSHLGQPKRAVEYFEKALKISRDVGDRSNEGMSLGNLGAALSEQGRTEEAVNCFAQALAIARAAGDVLGEVNGLMNLGNAFSTLGRTAEAIASYEQALAAARAAGDALSESRVLGNLGCAYSDLGRLETATGYFDERLRLARRLGDRRGEAVTLGNLGNVYLRMGHAEKALKLLESNLEIAREVGDRRGEGAALGNLGNAYFRGDLLDRAAECYEQELKLARETGDRAGEARALGSLGNTVALQGQTTRGIELIEQAVKIGREIKDAALVRVSTALLDRLRGGPRAVGAAGAAGTVRTADPTE